MNTASPFREILYYKDANALNSLMFFATFSPRAVPNHSMAVDKNGEIVSIEVGLRKQSVSYTCVPYVHTNHAIHESMQHLERGSSIDSQTRYQTAREFISRRTLDNRLARQILRSHANKPCTICIHPETGDNSDGQTVASAIVNLSEMSLAVTLGNPCRSRYEKFYL